jgi:hypothetical protein
MVLSFDALLFQLFGFVCLVFEKVKAHEEGNRHCFRVVVGECVGV